MKPSFRFGAGLLAVLMLGAVFMDCVNPALAEAQAVACCRSMSCAAAMTTPQSCCRTNVSSHPVFVLQGAPQVHSVAPVARELAGTLRTQLENSARMIAPYGHAPPGALLPAFSPLRI